MPGASSTSAVRAPGGDDARAGSLLACAARPRAEGGWGVVRVRAAATLPVAAPAPGDDLLAWLRTLAGPAAAAQVDDLAARAAAGAPVALDITSAVAGPLHLVAVPVPGPAGETEIAVALSAAGGPEADPLEAVDQGVLRAVLLPGPDVRIVRANAAWWRMWGPAPAAGAGAAWTARVHPDDRAALRRALRRLAAGARAEVTVRLASAGGGVRRVRLAATADRRGTVTAVATDVSAERRREDLLARLLEAVPEAVYEARPGADGALVPTLVGPGLERLLRRPVPTDPAGAWAAWRAAVHPDDAERVGAWMDDAALAPLASVHEYRLVRPSGEVAFVRETRLPADDGGVVGVIADITPERLAGQRLRLPAEAGAGLVFDAELLPGGGWRVFGAGRQSPRTLGPSFGDDPDEAGRRMREAIHPEDRARVIDRVREAAITGAPVHVAYRVRADGGEVRWTRLVLMRREVAADRVVVSAVATDVTALRLDEERAARMVDALGEAVAEAEVGRAGALQITWASAALERLVGRPLPEDPVERARAWLAWMHPDDRDRVLLGLTAAARTGAAVRLRHRAASPDGAVRTLTLRAAPAGDADPGGGGRRYALLIADVTGEEDGGERLARVLDAVEDVVVEATRADDGWRVERATAGLARIAGVPVPAAPEDVAALVRGMLPHDQRARLDAELDAVAARGDSSSVVVRVLRPDGGSRWVRVTAARTGSRGGRGTVGAVLRDITELRRAREGLRRALESVSDIVREARLRPDGSWELLYLSPVAERLLGRPLPDDPSHRLALHAAAVHPDDAAGLDARARAVVARGVPDTLVYRVRRPDGEVRIVRAALCPLDDGAGGVALTEVASDVTELVGGAPAGDSRLEGVIAGIGEAVYEMQLDADGTSMTYASPRLWAIIGAAPPAPDRAMQTWTSAVHPGDRARAADALARVREGVPLALDLRMVRPDGEIRTVRVTARPRLLPGGGTRVAGTVADVTGERHDPLPVPAPLAVAPTGGDDCPLTERQLDVLRLVGEGAGTEEVARLLGIRTVTVANHVAAVLRRLDARSRLEAVAKARQAGWLR